MPQSVHYSKKTKNETKFNKKFFQYSRADKNALQQQYDTTIADVNQRVSDKATLQINLNETRDTVRETNQDVSYDNMIIDINSSILV